MGYFFERSFKKTHIIIYQQFETTIRQKPPPSNTQKSSPNFSPKVDTLIIILKTNTEKRCLL
jgi:hypothetical protein